MPVAEARSICFFEQPCSRVNHNDQAWQPEQQTSTDCCMYLLQYEAQAL